MGKFIKDNGKMILDKVKVNLKKMVFKKMMVIGNEIHFMMF